MEEVAQGLSARGQHFIANPNMVQKLGRRVVDNLFDIDSNPEGIINMGLAESKLTEDIMMERLRRPDLTEITPDILYYFSYEGQPSFKKAVCNFFEKYLKPAQELNPENVVFTSGSGAAMEMIAYCVADPGDCFLCLAPLYTGLKADFSARVQTKLVMVHLPFTAFTEEADKVNIPSYIGLIKEAFDETRSQGQCVKGIVLLNPNNPVGYIMPKEFVKGVLDFANSHDLHVIMNEVYALSTFGDMPFNSFLEIDPLPNPTKTHLVWTFSKDFHLAGLRCGVLYTRHEGILACAPQLMYFGSVPTLIQNKLQVLINDYEWIDQYLEENRRRALDSFVYSKARLDDLGIPYVNPSAAFFFWVDLSKHLPSSSYEGELELFTAMLDGGIHLLPGQFQGCKAPGWFRLTFVLNRDVLQEAFERLQKVICRM